jgi:hypothetical protein
MASLPDFAAPNVSPPVTTMAFAAELTPKTATPGAASSPAPAAVAVPATALATDPVTDPAPVAAPSLASNGKRDPSGAPPAKPPRENPAAATPHADSDPATPFAAHAMTALHTASPVDVKSAPLPAEPPSSASESPRLAASSLSEPAAPLTSARLHDVTVRIAPPDAPSVDVQVNARQGQVYVAVRTADPGLQTSLRQDLPQLVNSLDRAGFRTETFVPHAAGDLAVGAAAESSLGSAAQDASHDSPSDSSPQDRSFGRDASPSSGSPDQQQQQQRQREQMQQRWLNQMED